MASFDDVCMQTNVFLLGISVRVNQGHDSYLVETLEFQVSQKPYSHRQKGTSNESVADLE